MSETLSDTSSESTENSIEERAAKKRKHGFLVNELLDKWELGKFKAKFQGKFTFLLKRMQ